MEFDYYIYIDYSENLIGYIIIEKEKIQELLKKILNFRHFKELRHKRTYLIKIKNLFERENINSLIYKQKISCVRDTLSIFDEIAEFVNKNKNSLIFISIDNNQYTSFVRLFRGLFNQTNIFIIKENKLKKASIEYRLSLIIDSLLNIKRIKEQSK